MFCLTVSSQTVSTSLQSTWHLQVPVVSWLLSVLKDFVSVRKWKNFFGIIHHRFFKRLFCML